jgi:hypothetical protein
MLIPVGSTAEVREDRRSAGVQLVTHLLLDGPGVRHFIDVTCPRPHLHEVFSLLVAEMLAAVEADPERPDRAFHRVLDRWRELLDRPPSAAPDDDTVCGVLGELLQLRELVRRNPAALARWLGPTGARHDFEAPGLHLEVKTSRSRGPLLVEIHGLEQLAFERCLCRRHARQIQRIEKDQAKPWPADCAAWIVAPHVPEWMREWEVRGLLELHAAAPGCVLVRPSYFPIVWIAANELPLHQAVIPFLLARSGTKLKEFVRWVVHVRPPEWLAGVVSSSPEVVAMLPEFKPDLSPEDGLGVIEGLRKALDAYPEVGSNRDRLLVPLGRLAAQGLGRGLTEAERLALAVRIDVMDGERFGDTILDLLPAQFTAWLGGLSGSDPIGAGPGIAAQ